MREASIRSFGSPDIEAILELERSCAEAPQWGEAFWRRGFPGDAALRGNFVAEIEGRACGYIVAACAAGIAELQSIVVSASARREGIGHALCERAMEWARERGAQTMELEVRESNTAALALYKRLGFVEQGKRPKYYRMPEEGAVLMAAKL